MTQNPCKRSWEVEALEDGRLSGKDRASFERHVESCQDCSRAIERLRTLGTALADLPTPEPSELDRRRARADLLARANEGMVGANRRSKRWAFVLVPALVALALVVVMVRRGPSPAPVAVAPAAAAPRFEVADVDHADFTTERVDAISRVVLRSGSASFHVERVLPGARFLVALPDGEVEVRGTRFVVDVVDGRTRSVSVTEGVVAVRIGGVERVLRAGESWPRSEAAVVPGPTGSAATTGAVSLSPSPSVSPEYSARPPPSAAVAPAPVRPVPGPRFAEAMGAFNAGDYGAADRLFVAFVRDFPSDTRTEDAMFLLADARARRGDAGGAKEAARAYLRRFPNGLRAPAATRLAGDAPQAPQP